MRHLNMEHLAQFALSNTADEVILLLNGQHYVDRFDYTEGFSDEAQYGVGSNYATPEAMMIRMSKGLSGLPFMVMVHPD